MATDPSTKNNVIQRDQVRVVGAPAMLNCGTITEGKPVQPLAIVPLMDGDRVAGFEVRCGCGAQAIIECVYEDQTEPDVPQ